MLYGAYHSPSKKKDLAKLERILSNFERLPIDDCIEEYASIKQYLISKGQMIDEFDILIAATAKVYNLILVTNNLRHFGRIEGLTIEDWTKMEN